MDYKDIFQRPPEQVIICPSCRYEFHALHSPIRLNREEWARRLNVHPALIKKWEERRKPFLPPRIRFSNQDEYLLEDILEFERIYMYETPDRKLNDLTYLIHKNHFEEAIEVLKFWIKNGFKFQNQNTKESSNHK